MRKFVFLAVGIVALISTLALAGLFVVLSRAYAAPLPVELGTAGNYSVLGGTGVVSTLNTVLNANLGVSPSTSITGFPPGLVKGTTHAGDSQAAQAQSDLATAYNYAVSLTPTSTFAGDQGGKIFDAGVYYTASAFALTGTLTLDGQGNPNAVFIFQVDAALNTTASSTVSLINGAQASNVFWQVNGAAGTGASSSFSGNIMANGAITVGAGGSIDGRALATGTVTLADNIITTPDVVTFASPPTPTSALTTTTTDSVLAVGIAEDTGAITYASNTPSVCTVGSTTGALAYLIAGVCSIEAAQAPDSIDGFGSMTAITSITVTVPPSYAVTFNGNGSTAGSTATETANVPSALSANGFSRTGYAFSGWNTAALGTGASYFDGATYPFTAAVTLFAQWTANPSYAVTFNGNGSTAGSTATETANVPSALSANGFSRTGYAFSGWNTAALGTGASYIDGATYPFTAAVTLFAQWTANPGGGGSTTSPPAVTSISPAFGSTAGGTRVSITGTNFSGATVVKFGGATAINIVVVNSTTITAASPAGTAGIIDVTVTTPGGTSSINHGDNFTYVSAVPITLIQGSPISATVADGGGYSGQRAVTNGTGTVSYTETISVDSTYVVVTSTGAISAAISLSPGTYSVSGNDSDTNGDTGTWIFALTVTVATPGAPAGTTGDYDLVGSDGGVFVFGQSGTGFYGSLPGIGVHVNDIVGMVTTADNKGYYLVGSDGGVFAFGDATFYGSLPGIGVHVNDIVGMVTTADNKGYYLVGSDGGVFAFGDATFDGSLPGIGVHVNDIVGIALTANDGGYFLVGKDGGVFAFGDAPFEGSLPGLGTHVNNIVGFAATTNDQGYWIVGSGGHVYAFGDAPFEGSLPGMGIKVNNIISMVPSSDGKGYLLIGADGGVFAFGDATFDGSLPGIGIHVINIVGAVSMATGLGQ
jgi:uncharacterized repeat protein (TIGR02543 family)